MFNLYILNETLFNGYSVEFLDFIYLSSIFCGIFVIISKNPIISILFLIALFMCISGYLIILGINFIGLAYLLVYVGAVSILFLFILMLINVRISELVNYTNNSIPLAILIGISFNLPIYDTLSYNIVNLNKYTGNSVNFIYSISNNFNFTLNDLISVNKNKIILVTSKTWEGSLAETTHISSIGNILYSNYAMWLIITSIILLLAMVGSICLVISNKNNL